MNLSSVGAPQQQQQPQPVQVNRIQFTDDAGTNYGTFDNVSATRTADTNQTRRGFGIDLNNDGSYNAGTDGLLAFDLDGDGKYTSQDVADTQKYLRALSGETDLDGDGNVSFQERSDAHNMVKMFGSADLDQDGVIQGWEISELGGKVVRLGTDGDGNPTSSIQNLPGFEEGRQPRNQPQVFDPRNPPRNPEFEAWQNQMWTQWSSVLGFDIGGYMNQAAANPQPGGPMQFPPITAGMFGGGMGMGGGGMPAFPQFNFVAFDPMAGQSFGPNGFPSFMTQGLPFL